jgi:hypothetical protein
LITATDFPSSYLQPQIKLAYQAETIQSKVDQVTASQTGTTSTSNPTASASIGAGAGVGAATSNAAKTSSLSTGAMGGIIGGAAGAGLIALIAVSSQFSFF